MDQVFNHCPVARQYKLGGMQKFVAERLVASQHDTASVTAMAEIPAQPLLSAQQRSRAQGLASSLTHHMIHLVARCLEQYPRLNGALHEGIVYEFAQINVALAIAMPNGDLQTVVIREANHKSLADIVQETDALVATARAGKITLDQVRGGTFTLSNYGSLQHTTWATPIIAPGQSGVLGMGRTRPALVADDSEQGWQVAPILPLSFTYDHRIINGVPAGQFLEDLARHIHQLDTENPL
ncbi:2-oxo acid dehydrogenase subunit E2 [Castellaniella sp.]|uniref:2-oxo acid dehydrogenase subunit E2 n=1 Tax=Castellaniella sp. TaxID=1955812 RepID=UPI00355E4FFB